MGKRVLGEKKYINCIDCYKEILIILLKDGHNECDVAAQKKNLILFFFDTTAIRKKLRSHWRFVWQLIFLLSSEKKTCYQHSLPSLNYTKFK